MTSSVTIAAPALELVLELGGALSAVSPEQHRSLERRATVEIETLLAALGVAPGCRIRVEAGVRHEPLCVRFGARVLVAPPQLTEQLWQALLPEWDRDAQSMADALAAVAVDESEARQELLHTFLSALAVETLKLRPQRLLRPPDVERVATALRLRAPESTLATDLARLTRILSEPLAEGIACSPADPNFLAALSDADGEGSEDQLVESLISALRMHTAEVRVEREYLEALLERDLEEAIPLPGSAPRATELFYLMSDGLFYELGIRVPPVILVPDASLPPLTCRVCVSKATGPLIGLLPLDRVLTTAEPADLKEHGIAARSARNPANGNAASVAPAQDAARIDALGFNVWTPFEYLILVLSDGLRRKAAHLVDCETIEYELSQLDHAFPDLVRGALSCVPLARLTAVTRGLLRENVSVRNLRTILERMIGFCMSLANDPHIADTVDANVGALEFVRMGLRAAINAALADGSTLFLYLLAPEIEARLKQHFGSADSPVPLGEQQLDDLRDAIAGEIHPDRQQAVLLTHNSLRFALHDLLRDTLPHVAVLAWEEVAPQWVVEPLARIEIPQSWKAATESAKEELAG